jgi:hypothetical protein
MIITGRSHRIVQLGQLGQRCRLTLRSTAPGEITHRWPDPET